ncbi:uncharacterized protein LOC131670942 isoform X2 [Phymastichus coffea]|uniref:uncharacterized protein LOC131670942 isoform X2 n=1 Tax=Phymastichus coffea TaxID=108790 RepID=UPI00273C11B6|nr:uncharacterized protein LOC131670942 isoform X2 [Phymastichus coffea]
MGTYLSKDYNVVASPPESKGETCNQDTATDLDLIGKYHNYNYTSNIKKVIAKLDRTINERCNTLTKVHIKYAPTARNISLNETENLPFKYSDKVIDVAKLLNQLLNAKVVLEKLEDPLVKFPDNQVVNVRTYVDIADESDMTRKTDCKEYTHRYCAKCKKTVFARLKDPRVNDCSDCQVPMTHLCIKCNAKHYKRYAYLQFHWNRCNGNEAPPTAIDGNESNIKVTETCTNSKLVLNKDQFVVKKHQNENWLEKYAHYCSKCKITTSDVRRCSKCKKQLLFECKKCHMQCATFRGIVHHLRTRCCPINQYQCTHCNYAASIWSAMYKHFQLTHANDRPLFKCKLCPLKTKYNWYLKKHYMSSHARSTRLDY